MTRPPDAESAPHAGATRSEDVVVVLLAAGAGRRFLDDRHKLVAPLDRFRESPDRDAPTVIELAIDHALDAAVGPLIVVTGAVADVVPAHLRDHLHIAHNERWDDGQMSSLRIGLRAAGDLGAGAAVVGLADQPFIAPEAWRSLARAPGPIAVATYDGVRGNPVRLDAEVWNLLPADGDEGARALMRVRPDLVREVPCIGSPADIDTTEDLRRWQNN